MANPGPATTVAQHPSQLGTNQALRLLAVQKGVNLSATGDTVLPIINSTNYAVANVIVSNPSVALSTAAAGLFTAPSGASGSGTAIVASNTFTLSTGALVQETVATPSTIFGGQNLYFNVATAQGSGVTADVYVYGYDLS